MYVTRESFLNRISDSFAINPVTALLGPRQCGKSTLARQYSETQEQFSDIHYFDLEKPSDYTLLENAYNLLKELQGLIIIDEIQMQPELFKILRVLADETQQERRFLILGSASQELITQSSDSLAGRIEYIELTPFSILEVPDLKKLWSWGGYPKAYLAESFNISYKWRENYIRTFLERDIPQLGIKIPTQNMRRFWMMLAHYHGNYINYTELGRSLSLSHTTIKNYVDILSSTFMVRQLQPWFENIKKRQVKSPKIYIRDSGILHSLLDIGDKITTSPKLGASWEGFAIESIIAVNQKREEEIYYWATQSGAEIDLLFMNANYREGFEVKFSDKPKMTKSIISAIETLNLDRVRIIYPGDEDYKIADNVYVTGLQKYLSL